MTHRSGDWNGAELAGGRYQITARLGAGGMGAVYRALDRNLDAEVVIKVPHQTMLDDPDFAGRFTREIRSLVKLSHPRIVKVTDVGEWDGTPFAVMQFLPGGSLENRQQLRADGTGVPCDPREVPKWLIGIAQALDYVHGQGYIHRDVKPGNILFDAQGHSFLSDFGVAKVLSESSDPRAGRASMTGAGKVLGTPEYMAPELIMEEKIDGRVDQYALAITVYELLCGRRPFEGEGEVKTKVLVLHTTTPPPSLLTWQPSLSSKLAEAVLKGLAKSPNDRYPNCTALAAAVVAAVKELPARPEERVRIQCPACGKGLVIGQSDFARLQQTGQRVPCPGCREPIQVSGPAEAASPSRSGTVIVTGSGSVAAPQPGTPRSGTMVVPSPDVPPAAAAQRSGTMIVSGSGSSPTPQAAAQRSGTMVVPKPEPPAAAAQRSGTMIVGKPDAPAAPAQRSGTMIVGKPDAPAAPAQRSGTMIVGKPDAAAAPAQRSGTMIVSSPEASAAAPAQRSGTMIVATPANDEGYAIVVDDEPVRLTPMPKPAPRPVAEPTPSLAPRIWLAVGAGAATAAIAGVALFALMPGRNPQPATPADAPAQPKVAASTAVPKPGPLAGDTTGKPAPKPPVQVALTNNSAATPVPGRGKAMSPPSPALAPSPGDEPPANEPDSNSTPDPDLSKPEPANSPATNSSPITASKVEPPEEEWSSRIALLHPVRAKEMLDKVLQSAARYQNQLVIPEGMYCVEGRFQTLPSGRLQINVSRSHIDLPRNGEPSIRTLEPIDLDIEPKLVGELQQARLREQDLAIMPAILTVRVTSRGTCRLARAEFLTRFVPRYNPNGLPDVDYFSLKVSPDGSTPGKSRDEDWETLPRMLNIKNVCERKLKAMKNLKQAMHQNQIDRQMNSMFSSMMRSAVVNNARTEQYLDSFHKPR